MFISILLWTEMSLRLLGLAALWANRTPARDHFHTPARQHPHLRAGGPKANDRGGFGIFFFRQEFLDEQNDQVAFLVVAQANFADAEERIHRRVDTHHLFDVIA